MSRFFWSVALRIARTTTGAPPERRRGFTAIELLVVIAIAAILVAIALPSFTGVIARYRVQRASEDMVATLYFARSEAMRRGGQITLSRNPVAPGCSLIGTQDWSCGWIVFVDGNGNGTVDGADEVLRRTGIPERVDVMRTNNSGAFMTFNRWGQSSATFFGFNFQPSNFPSGTTKLVCVSSGGRIRTLTDRVPPCAP